MVLPTKHECSLPAQGSTCYHGDEKLPVSSGLRPVGMFWKNTAWSWKDAADNDDGGGYLLTTDLRRTPDSTPDSDLTCIATPTTAATTANQNHITPSTGLKDLTNHSLIPSHPHNLHPTNINCSSYVSTLFNTNHRQATPDSGSTQRLMVSVVRGKDGFGFTICSDCPVRVQAVDPGGPAHRSGLCQGDSVLQLNGLPVETWKCVDLAHAIRSCSSQMVLVVWRGLPELRSGCEALLRPSAHNKTTSRKLLPHPAHSKHGHRRGRGSGVRSSLRALSSLWRDRKEDCEEEEEEEQEQEQEVTELLQPVYHDRSGTIGCLYQTHPGRGQNLLHNPRPGSQQQQLFPGSTLPPPPSTPSSSAPPSNYSNYQNCTIIQSHLPCSAYGTYGTLTPKTLIFPIFVQPLDLCSPDRTLLMSEEMVLHQADLLPAKVTVLIYSDLLLFTREDEAGRCNVLQSPLYLNTLQLREVASEPLQIYFLRSSQGCWRCLFSLEAFSIQQRVRVSFCLHDNIKLQLVATETRHSHQLSDLPSDFGLLSVCQPDLFYGLSSPFSSFDPPLLLPSSLSTSYSSLKPSSPGDPSPPFTFLSPYTSSRAPRTFTNPPPTLFIQRSPVWKQQGVAEEEGKEEDRRKRRQKEVEERQLGEGESTSETRHFNLKEEEVEESDKKEQEEEEEEGGAEEFISSKPAVLRRSLSEGSLLKEPPSPRFLSDSTIHRPPSICPLREQLTLHHMLLSLNGTKDTSEFRNFQLRMTTPSAREVLRWAESLEDLLTNQYGLAVFHHFLRLEFSEENLDFWLAVERFKRTRPLSKMAAKAVKIYNKFISTTAVRQVNVDSAVRELTNQGLRLGVNPTSFQLAQDQIFDLMETDSYPRFLKSRLYAQLTNQGIQTATESCSQSRVGTILVSQS